MWMPDKLTYIGYIPIPRKWKQICARWTCTGSAGGGNGGSLVWCGSSGFLLEARQWVFSVEHDGIGIHVCRVPWQRQQIWSAGLLSRLFLFASLFWSLLEHKVYKKHCNIIDLVRPMLMKRTRRWHWLVFYWCLGFLHMFNVLTVNACVQLGLLIVKCLLDYTYLSRQTYRPFASTLNYFFCPGLLDSTFLFHMLYCH